MTGIRVYAGSFTTSGKDKPERADGIYLCRLDLHSGRLDRLEAFHGGPSPAFLALSTDGRFLYAVNEVSHFQGRRGGGVSAFTVDRASGRLARIDSHPSGGEIPCYLSLDATGSYLLVANYASGNAAVFPVAPDGSLGPRSDLVQHEGRGVDPARQEKAHVHSIRMNPTNHFALAADLGLDQIRLYDLHPQYGKLQPHQPPVIQLPAGAGPRHLEFHPRERWFYVLNELNSTLAAYQSDPPASTFTAIHSVSTLPEGYSGENWPADIHVHPGGRWLVTSNRGHDSLAVFAIDPANGRVTLKDLVPSRGKMPLHFSFDPSGQWLIAANQASDNLAVFSFAEATGRLAPVGSPLEIPSPTCVLFAP